MRRTSLQFLDDIIHSAEKIESYTKDITFEEFAKDPMRVDAVIRNFEVIGEAVKNLPEEVRQRYPDTDWKKVAGFRDVLTHAYFGIKPSILWDNIKTNLPVLKSEIRKIMRKENSRNY
jgi:uncharacterized protein with HEPN domain